jgi:hypothetical protein
MTKCPKVGSRVRFKGNLVVGPCTGTVLRIYEHDEWPESFPTGLAPESDWSVRLKCDKRPTPWCYGDDLVFAPSVSDLSPLNTPPPRNPPPRAAMMEK